MSVLLLLVSPSLFHPTAYQHYSLDVFLANYKNAALVRGFVSIYLSSISMCSLFTHSQSSGANFKLGECLTRFGPFSSQEIRLWAVIFIYVAAYCFRFMQPFSDELETGVKSVCAAGGLTHCPAHRAAPGLPRAPKGCRTRLRLFGASVAFDRGRAAVPEQTLRSRLPAAMK